MSTAQAGRLAHLSASRFELCIRASSRPATSGGPQTQQAHDLSRPATSAGPWPQQAHDLSRPAASAEGCRGKRAVLEQ